MMKVHASAPGFKKPTPEIMTTRGKWLQSNCRQYGERYTSEALTMLRNPAPILLLLPLFSCQPKPQEPPAVEYLMSELTRELNLPFSDAVRVDKMLFVSGQIGIKPGTLELVPGGIAAEARQAIENIRTVLESNGSSLNHVVKVTVMMADISEWGDFNKVYVTYFSQNLPARSALGASGLALGAKVEIECIATIPSK